MDRIVGFNIPGNPQGKLRARTVWGGKRTYTPHKTVDYEELIRWSYRQSSKDIFDQGEPLEVYIVAWFKPAKSTPKYNVLDMLKGLIFPTKKPDIDNIAKVILDALNGVAYKDDTQVMDLRVSKRYAKEASVAVIIQEVVTK